MLWMLGRCIDRDSHRRLGELLLACEDLPCKPTLPNRSASCSPVRPISTASAAAFKWRRGMIVALLLAGSRSPRPMGGSMWTSASQTCQARRDLAACSRFLCHVQSWPRSACRGAGADATAVAGASARWLSPRHMGRQADGREPHHRSHQGRIVSERAQPRAFYRDFPARREGARRLRRRQARPQPRDDPSMATAGVKS